MITICHHSDADGKISGGIIYNYEKEFIGNNEDIICIEIDYTDIIDISNIDYNSTVYFVDYSFSIEDNIYALIDLINTKHCKVIWIDHHKSSQDLLDSGKLDPIINRREFVRYINTDFCASYLCYEWTYTKIVGYTIPIEKCPSIIKYVDSWDTWKHNMPYTIEFNNGFYIQDFLPKEFADRVIDNDLSFYTENSKCSDEFVNDCISKGNIITKYKEIENASICKKSSFEFFISNIDDHVIYKCLAINGRGNSTVFGKLINDYDIVCLFRYQHNQWVYSLYSNKDDVDCSYIANILGKYENLGGGGHKGAAGFQTYSCIIDNDCTISFRKIKFLRKLFGEYDIGIMGDDYYE